MILICLGTAFFLALAVMCVRRRWRNLIGIVSPLLYFVIYLPLGGGRELPAAFGMGWLFFQAACLLCCAAGLLIFRSKQPDSRACRTLDAAALLLTAFSAGFTFNVLFNFVCVKLDILLLPVPGYGGH